ncbi:MAG: hypothetical protein L0312_22275 [Acidobacteria bacterium]|nr:hypothetical protein [Acidobacteriota bacterium]
MSFSFLINKPIDELRYQTYTHLELKMDWRDLPSEQRPTFSQLAYDAGSF